MMNTKELVEAWPDPVQVPTKTTGRKVVNNLKLQTLEETDEEGVAPAPKKK